MVIWELCQSVAVTPVVVCIRATAAVLILSVIVQSVGANLVATVAVVRFVTRIIVVATSLAAGDFELDFPLWWSGLRSLLP